MKEADGIAAADVASELSPLGAVGAGLADTFERFASALEALAPAYRDYAHQVVEYHSQRFPDVPPDRALTDAASRGLYGVSNLLAAMDRVARSVLDV